MKLKDAGPRDEKGQPLGLVDDKKPRTLGQGELAKDSPQLRGRGREVFLNNCAICHSSKQPDGFDLRFARDLPGGWEKAAAPVIPDAAKTGQAPQRTYTLPMDFGHWEEFKRSPAYRDYRDQINDLAKEGPESGKEDEFLKDNFLSNELRIPITLVGTNSGRSMATNAMRGNVWDYYSSETFKKLPSVGKIRYFNPFPKSRSVLQVDPVFGTNDEYDDGRTHGGPGYMRPPSLISLWATAPYFHNNALGLYNRDPSVRGRVEAFQDGLERLLWNSKRAVPPSNPTARENGDLRAGHSSAAQGDPGYIYRLPVDTHVMFQPGFTRPLLEGIFVGLFGAQLGHMTFLVLSFWLWVFLVALFAILIFKGTARHAGVLLLGVAILLAAVLALTGAGGAARTVTGTLMLGATGVLDYASGWLWLFVAALIAAGFGILWTRNVWRLLPRILFAALTVVFLFTGILANKFLNGRLKEVPLVLAVLPNSWLNAEYKGIKVGPIPRGTPVNLLMNMDPDKRDKAAPALVGLLRALAEIRKQQLTGEAAYEVLRREAGPALIEASKCPDFVLDRGHWFGEALSDDDKKALIAFLKTL